MSPADLLPAQIAEALQILADKRGISLRVGCQPGGWCQWQASQHMPDYRHRHGFGETMDAACEQMMLADFKEGTS